MATRVDPDEVRAVVRGTALDFADIDRLIVVANRLVTDVLSGKGMSDERLRDIELYISAHLVALTDQDAGMVTRKSVGETEAEYGGELGAGLAATRFGRMALDLDTSNALSSVGKARAQFRAFG